MKIEIRKTTRLCGSRLVSSQATLQPIQLLVIQPCSCETVFLLFLTQLNPLTTNAQFMISIKETHELHSINWPVVRVLTPTVVQWWRTVLVRNMQQLIDSTQISAHHSDLFVQLIT